MERHYLSKRLIQATIENGLSFENLRLYVITRIFHSQRSGHFTFNELSKTLISLGMKSIVNKSNRNKFYKKNFQLFNDSMFFKRIEKGRGFQIISEKKILIQNYKSANTIRYEIPLEVLKSRQAFNDFCIGVMSGKEISNNTLSKKTKLSKRRIQYATNRNNLNQYFKKIHRFVMIPANSKNEAKQEIHKLYSLHGIVAKLVNISDSYFYTLNTTNKYKALTFGRFRGKVVKGHTKQVKRDRFVKFSKGKSETIVNGISTVYLKFNNYSLGGFINDNSNNKLLTI